jgi:hypothetical protein
MDDSTTNRIATTKVLFVWDGTDRFVEAADQFG